MKLTSIAVWNQPDSRYTRVRRCYDNTYMEHTVWVSSDEVRTILRKDGTHDVFKPGIQHLTRPL